MSSSPGTANVLYIERSIHLVECSLSNFWKRVASPFVVMDDEPAAAPSPPSDASDPTAYLSAENAALLADLAASTSDAPPPPPPAATPSPSLDLGSGIATGRPFSEIYASAEVPLAPYTAEQILKVIEGLKNMPRESMVAVIGVMDDADPNWTINDVLLDVDRKTIALEQHISAMNARVGRERESARQTAEKAQTLLAEATSEIQQQIQELQNQLTEFQAEASQQIAQAEATLREIEHSATTETQRLQAESERLRNIARFLQMTNSED